jgi:PAS domain S-box-containing protein
MLGFLHLVITPPESSLLYRGNYDPVLVGLSIVVAIFASYASLLVSQHVSTTTTTTSRRLWIAAGGLCLGIGIWAMHFVGMLAFSLPCSSSYDATLTLLSTIPSILASALALKIISRRTLSHAQLATGGLLLGAGIGAMHYSGMAAMRLNGLIRYDIKLFSLSILVAIALATLALWIKFRLQLWQARWNAWATIAGAVVMGLAVSGMHYTAMAAAYFVRDGDTNVVASGISPTFLAAIVLAATCLIIVVTIVATYVGKPNVFSLGRSYKLIGFLIVGWGTIAWLSADYYYGHLASNLYQRESQLAKLQAEQVAGNIDESLQLLKGVSLVFSRDDDTHLALRRFGVNVAPSTLGYEERKQRWTRDKMLGELNGFLEIAAANLGADNIFIVNAAGDCIAAYNAGQPDSFVGTNYADREYFRQARAGRRGHQYAVGRKSNIPGLFYSYPVFDAGHFLGAVVVKRDITKFAHWTSQANAFISDANGVIILAPDKQLEFRALPNAAVAKLSAENRLKQYKRSAFDLLDIIPWESKRFPSAVRIGGGNLPVVLASKVLPEDAITVHAPRPLGELVRLDTERILLFLLLTAAGSMVIVAASTVVLYLRESQKTAADLRVAATAFESQEGMVITDAGSVILRINRAFTDITGYTAEDALGQKINLLKSGRHETAFFAAMWESIRLTGAWQGEIWNRRKNGEAHPSWLTITAVKGRAGEVTHYVGTLTDITLRKQAEETLKQMNEILERRVREVVAKNREKDHLLIQQSRLAAMGEMIHNIAHQWRQPINALTLILANIKDAYEFNELDKEYLDGAVGTGQQLIQKMSSTIDDFRNFFRPGRENAPFPLRGSLDAAIVMVDAALKNNEIALSTLPAENVAVNGHANEFAQVLVNIISNAKDAIMGKNIRDGKIEIAIGQENGRAWLSVSDNGGGIPEEILGKVFDPYFTTKGTKGSGIGLYMSKMIMDDMSGDIFIRNIEGGTEVLLTLPLVKASSDDVIRELS